MKRLLLILAALSFTGVVWAHSGGTDAFGYHMDHKTGVYHCH
ncbi:YHYH domain-containing protein [Candidatus Vondammii sp. HM_W22]|nr:YHYH domain-containing protein [Candidatus Vondammii sp. HM_W22]